MQGKDLNIGIKGIAEPINPKTVNQLKVNKLVTNRVTQSSHASGVKREKIRRKDPNCCDDIDKRRPARLQRHSMWGVTT